MEEGVYRHNGIPIFYFSVKIVKGGILNQPIEEKGGKYFLIQDLPSRFSPKSLKQFFDNELGLLKGYLNKVGELSDSVNNESN